MTELGDISAAMRVARPVFIVGEARSGSSILYRTLQRHSAFRPTTESLVESQMFPHLPRAFLFNRSYPRPWIKFMLNDDVAWQAFLHSIRVPRVTSAVLAPANYAVKHRVPWLWRASLAHLVLRSFAFHATAARGCQRLVEKTPRNTHHLHKLTTAFPNAALLYIHRHPVDVYSSYRRRAIMDPASASWSRMDVEAFCQQWTTSVEQVLAWLDTGPKNLLPIRYETFVTDPGETFRQVCAFLDEPFEEAAVLEERPAADLPPEGANVRRPIMSRTKSWADYMSHAEAETVQHLTGATMRRLGYEPYPVAG